MNNILAQLLLMFLCVSVTTQAQWSQVGIDIDGETGDSSGRVLDINSDGSVVVIGAIGNENNGFQAGQVRIYKNINGNWGQIGQDINGEEPYDHAGSSVSISSNGLVVAIGAIGNDGNGLQAGNVRVFKNINNSWVQLGNNIEGDTHDFSGGSVSLNDDGSIVAIGEPRNDGNGVDSGRVRIYKIINNNWIQLGQDIYGEEAHDHFGGGGPYIINSGESVSLNSNGNVLAVAAQFNDGNGTDSGHVRIYKFISIINNGTWLQIGQDIEGEEAGDELGLSLDLNFSGSIIAIASNKNDGNGIEQGQVRIFENIGDNWVQIGQSLYGEYNEDWFGSSLSLSSDGSIIAIGAKLNDSNGDKSGYVQIYNNSNGMWGQIGEDIIGESELNFSGIAVSLSSDGAILAIGATGNNDNGENSGHVRVFKNESLGILESSNLQVSIYPNPAKEILNLKYTNNISSRVIIYDVLGKLMYKEQLSFNNNLLKIDISNFEKGIYFIKIQDLNQVHSAKFIKD